MKWQKKQFNEKQFDILRKQGVAPIFCGLLSNRMFEWVKNKKDIGTLIESPLSLLEDPCSVANMDKAAEEFLSCEGKHIVVYGDYDADGILSAYLCEKLLLSLNAASVDTYLPTRIDDGYGLNKESVENFLALCKKKYYMLVALDCGTSSKLQIERIKEKLGNIKVIVIDHHIVDENNFSSNADYVVNPRLNNATQYCTGGLVYQLARQCSKTSNAINHIKYLPYAAISTITDVCTLVGSNRVIVKNGLDALKMCQDPGICSLFKVAEIDKTKCCTEDISYSIGPMINASGRIRIAAKAFQLLRKQNEKEAMDLATLLKNLNEQRKKIQKCITEEAMIMFEAQKGEKNSALLYEEKWNPGIVGIVASKITDKYKIPAICFGSSKGAIKGSARSVGRINIKEVMDMCPDLFVKYGGHEMAAGATLSPEHLHDAWEVFDRCVAEYKRKHKIGDPIVEYDFEVDQDLLLRIDDTFCDRMSMLEPYGNGNELPVFFSKGVYLREVKVWKSGSGAFVNIDNTSLQSFSFLKNIKLFEGQSVDILFSLVRSFMDISKWKSKWNIRVSEVRVSK